MHSRERLSIYSQRIKKNLLLSIEETIGPLTNKQQQLLTTLEVIRIEDFWQTTSRQGFYSAYPQESEVDKSKRKRGRPKKGEEHEPVVVEPKRLEKQKSMSLAEMLASLPKECDVGAKKIRRDISFAGKDINYTSIQRMGRYLSAVF